MVSGYIRTEISEEMTKKIDKVIETVGGVVGPGCCHFKAPFPTGAGAEFSISNVGDRATCDAIIKQWNGTLLDYTQGRDCPKP